MTERRYFYTDPLAAAWMILHFDILIESDFSIECRYRVHHEEKLVKRTAEWPKLYVRPDSLHLLEPQLGDLVGPFLSSRVDPINGDDYQWAEVVQIADQKFLPFGSRIIQRKGFAFHWPESEAT